ncbi:uncharacterized protein Dwil_GK25450 [Drosophila willistoni]|uniref:Cupin-like domain-containing protein n=1 Tax=Drosophila willistoni TaxID=7260 RepID=B4N3U3_DROWI|nr:uncharacterized protein LOC6645359 [Drosophila willistoni]EDW79298.1 uncharacterized protein Dwil_GK25450 [Drosophila willistoni]
MFLFISRHQSQGNRLRAVRERLGDDLVAKLDALHVAAMRTGLVSIKDLQEAFRKAHMDHNPNRLNFLWLLGIIFFIMVATPVFYEIISFLLGVRCFLPNNSLVWEATRPISDCEFCKGVKGPLILSNLTREEFAPYAYSSLPIIVKQAVAHWPAKQHLNYKFIKHLYENTPGSLETDCQFLHFNSDLKSLKDLLEMPLARVEQSEGSPWFVGWSVCQPTVLAELRKLFPRPHFLPVDAEMPHADFILMGYEQGAVMHLEYIPRLMWQAQLLGNKSWFLAPAPECDHQCQSFSFYVEPGDAVLVDTRIWYHANTIPKGEFSLTVQSEYG